MMGEDSVLEELLQLIRGLGSSFSHRLVHLVDFLFNSPRAGSIGAVAGFAIAVVWAWKYLKSPGNQRKRLEKREGPSAQSSSEVASSSSSSTLALSQTHPMQEEIFQLNELGTPIQLTISEIVRKQLNGGRKMTCQLLGVIFEETSPEELQMHAIVRPAVVPVILELSRACDLYLMSRLHDDESEVKAIAALEAVGLFSIGGLNRNKVLFCSTEAGRASFVRQLEPDWHVDTSLDTISQLARFIRYELLISSKANSNNMAPNILESESLESYFGQLNH